MLSERAAEKAATVSICHHMSIFQDPSIKDKLESNLNRNNSSSPACQADRSAPWDQRPDMKSNSHNHKLMKSSRFSQTMKTVWATFKYPDHSIKMGLSLPTAEDELDWLFRPCVNQGQKNHRIMTFADSGWLFYLYIGHSKKESTHTWNTWSTNPAKLQFACYICIYTIPIYWIQRFLCFIFATKSMFLVVTSIQSKRITVGVASIYMKRDVYTSKYMPLYANKNILHFFFQPPKHSQIKTFNKTKAYSQWSLTHSRKPHMTQLKII